MKFFGKKKRRNSEGDNKDHNDKHVSKSGQSKGNRQTGTPFLIVSGNKGKQKSREYAQSDALRGRGKEKTDRRTKYASASPQTHSGRPGAARASSMDKKKKEHRMSSPKSASPERDKKDKKKTVGVKAHHTGKKALKDRMKNWVLGKAATDISADYVMGKNIGQPGKYGFARICNDKFTNQQYAVKCISKTKFKVKGFIDFLKREVKIMTTLKPHPNIIKFINAYEDDEMLYLVMEYCTGGELFDRIISKQQYNEGDASKVVRQVFASIGHLHSAGISHCDIKPDNFLFASQEEDAALKLIDFGMSKRETFSQYHNEICGTSYYVAPEVLSGRYNKAADIWSGGVVMYIMLYGTPPFAPDPDSTEPQNDQIFRRIREGFHPVEKEGWGPWFPKGENISAAARDLMARLLTTDLALRPTADEILAHPWIRGQASHSPIDIATIRSLKHFDRASKFKMTVITSLGDSLSDIALQSLQRLFEDADEEGSGYITLEALEKSVAQAPGSMGQASPQVTQIIDNLGLERDAVISYEDLLLAATERHLLASQDRIKRAFDSMDADGDGCLTPQDLKGFLEKNSEAAVYGGACTLINEVDRDNDGKIDFDDFMFALRGRTNTMCAQTTLMLFGDPKLNQEKKKKKKKDKKKKSKDGKKTYLWA